MLPHTTVTDNQTRSRFEMAADGGTAFVVYRRAGNVLSLTHAEVPAALEGHGVGSALARGTLDLIRARGEKMIPLCTFVAHFVRTHPEYNDLLAGTPRNEVDETSEESFPASDPPGWISGEKPEGAEK